VQKTSVREMRVSRFLKPSSAASRGRISSGCHPSWEKVNADVKRNAHLGKKTQGKTSTAEEDNSVTG